MDASRETTAEFWRRVYTVIVMWMFGSTLAGWFVAWILGALGLLVHLLVLFRRRRQRAA
jgi:hypothetical protein